jgi:sugar phosphate isomerase/epimerase
VTAPGIPNHFVLSTACFGTRLESIEDQIFAAVAMGFRRIELGLSEAPPSMDGLEDSKRETMVAISSLVAGCRDNKNGHLAAHNLGSLGAEERERAMNSIRRHVRLAVAWGCPTVVVRGSKVESKELRDRGRALEMRMLEEASDESFQAELAAYSRDIQTGGHRQIEHLCRSLHTLMSEAPDVRFAIEPGRDIDDLLGFDAMGWVLDDLNGKGLGYWHDVGRIHVRSRQGLHEHGQWLEAFASRMVGVHMQDAADEEAEMPLGLGEVDFKLLASYVPRDAERVLELNPRHGRAEILASIQFLVDNGF